MARWSSATLAAALLVACSAAGVHALYGAKTPVLQLTPDNFEAEVLKSKGLVLVEFYAPWCGHCKALTPEWEKAAKALSGSVKIAAVDADKHRDLGNKYGVQGFPTIKIFGADKTKPKEYEGGRKADDIVKSALAELKALTNERLGIKGGGEEKKQEQKQQQAPPSGFYEGSDVVELTDDNFESEVINGKEAWLVEFYAPWCGHCKSLTPEWKKAATELAGTMKIAAVDATVQRKLAEKYKIEGFPTIKFFAPGAEAPEEYNGGRTSQSIVEYCTKKAELYPGKPIVVEQAKDDESLQPCYKKNMCVVFIVPHVIDTGAAGRNAMISMFNDISSKLRSRGVAFAWIAGGEHEAFEQAFGIQATYPTFVGINAARKRYATHKGRFDLEGITTSIKKILDGKQGVSQLSGDLPKLSKNVPLWDGKDYVASDE